jgi:outer membrane protein assembly factor BamD
MTEQNNRTTFFVLITALALSLGWWGCSSTKEVEQMSVEQRFAHAMKLFNDQNYLDAYEEFRIVTLQFQGSAVADDAQFHMAECRFKREEYVLAAYEYDVLIRTMPTSRFVSKARYQRAMCYYKLSPAYYLDQTYTKQAIDEFQSFIEYSPTDSLATQADAKINELNTKLARKEYENGMTYIHMEYYKSAFTCFENVTEKYHDTPYAEQAQYKKAEVQLLRKHIPEAKAEIEKFLTKYPNSSLKTEAEDLQKRILATPPQKAPEPAKSPMVSTEH